MAHSSLRYSAVVSSSRRASRLSGWKKKQRSMRLVRQHAALLLGAEIGERQLGHADLGETERHGTRDGPGHGELHAAPVPGAAP